MKYFITGGAGFIGANYVEHLFHSGKTLTKVTVYDNFTYAGNAKNFSKFKSDPRFNVVVGDICDLGKLRAAMKDHNYVINFAAESHVDRSIDDSSVFVRTNVLGTLNVLDCARKSGIQTVIQISTDEVYGTLSQGSANEDYNLSPNSPYAASKASADLLARSYFVTHGLDVRITRCSNNYGKYQYPEKVIPVFIRKLAQNGKVPIYGNGRNVREWIHVQDHCRGIQVVLEDGSPGEIYNIGSGIHFSNNDLASRIIEIMKCSDDSRVYVEDRLGHDFRYSVDSCKIAALGFSPIVDLDSGLEGTIKWYLENLDWWSEP